MCSHVDTRVLASVNVFFLFLQKIKRTLAILQPNL